jgi:uncharacterized protein
MRPIPDQHRMSAPVLTLPGLHGSEPVHWQSHWERDLPDARRVDQSNWDEPDLEAWLGALAVAVRKAPGAILVAHSLGVILLAHLAARGLAENVGAALLVAPADVETNGPIRSRLQSFAPIPRLPLRFPAIVVASEDDPYASLEWSQSLARDWGADFAPAGALGHINAASGIGDWPQGRRWLSRLAETVTARAERPYVLPIGWGEASTPRAPSLGLSDPKPIHG